MHPSINRSVQSINQSNQIESSKQASERASERGSESSSKLQTQQPLVLSSLLEDRSSAHQHTHTDSDSDTGTSFKKILEFFFLSARCWSSSSSSSPSPSSPEPSSSSGLFQDDPGAAPTWHMEPISQSASQSDRHIHRLRFVYLRTTSIHFIVDQTKPNDSNSRCLELEVSVCEITGEGVPKRRLHPCRCLAARNQ